MIISKISQIMVTMAKNVKSDGNLFPQTFKVEEIKVPSHFSILNILTEILWFYSRDKHIVLISELANFFLFFFKQPYLGQNGKK